MYNPIATYRLQFHQEFSFDEFEKQITYLQKLGVSTIYASPVFASTKGSTHGYDGVDPNQIDPEIGNLEQLKVLSARLKKENIGWLQDIVPNHMAFHPENPWLMDMLEKGRQSVYNTFFDVAWNSRLFQGKLMIPFLAAEPEELLEEGKIRLDYTLDRFCLKHEDACYPLYTDSYLTIFNPELVSQHQSLAQLSEQVSEITGLEDQRMFSLRWNELLLQLASLMKNDEIRQVVDARISEMNEDKETLRALLDEQTYVLCNWQNTEHHINFRRFFTVNGLICLNIQREEVFDEYHDLTRRLVNEGIFQGLRIDHIDGLYDPEVYLSNVRQMAGDELFVVVEKILGKEEKLPEDWPVQGTTGYEFLSWVNNLMTNSNSESLLNSFYEEITQRSETAREQLIKKKSMILFDHMAGELENLTQLFIELNLLEPEYVEEAGRDNIKRVIGEFLIHFPVYRFYGKEMPLDERSCEALKPIFCEIKKYNPDLVDVVILMKEAILRWTEEGNQEYNERLSEFYQRCMQFTGPLMAKGGEDTLMYTYNRFIGHNDVGDSPENHGLSTAAFHTAMQERNEKWPLSLNATSTHDTKRGEDVRARLNVLTDLPEEWIEQVRIWREVNEPLLEAAGAPDANDEYLIYQMLLGTYPMPGIEDPDYDDRFEAYLQKALREAKEHSDWREPNTVYEAGVVNFAKALLDQSGDFWQRFSAFHQRVAEFGVFNSLAQLVLKFTCPGTPDVYQGCELWDFSMVDPDNRRAVDYEERLRLLTETENFPASDRLFAYLWEHRMNGQIKLWLTRQLFLLRKQNPELFAAGDYIPLKVQGYLKDHIVAFARIAGKEVLVIAVPINVAAVCKKQEKAFFDLDWKDTKISLPGGLEDNWQSVLTGKKLEKIERLLPGELFKELPVAIIKGKKKTNQRKSGILAHISSLASPFGIGDLGPEAFAFADFLARSRQKLWQMLPLNPTEPAQGNSPYSALSSRAGNPLLISPELLAADGLLEGIDLSDYHLPRTDKADYLASERIKMELLEKAHSIFIARDDLSENEYFKDFCERNREWLDDFALYMALREKHDNKAWAEWEAPFRLRDTTTLQTFSEAAAGRINFFKWVQYMFDKQWKSLKNHCNKLDISLFGDIPFYVSYNSSDVWAHSELFMLDGDGKITGIAGVPPDSFSDDGQLWGMPVFRWDMHKQQAYKWWIARLAKNTELFDLVRLDHFRAFADHWVVPGGEKTAVNGSWEQGPGADFFKTIETALGGLPFVAEDLGEHSPAIHTLRDAFNLPGMKVLQFAFDDHMPKSDHIIHNYMPNFIAYTGTHDNNTIRGWFCNDLDHAARRKFEAYAGRPVEEQEVYDIAARMIFSSVAQTVILPVQDLLNLGESAKMNHPGSGEGNWLWRLLPGQTGAAQEEELRNWTVLYNRD